MIQRPTGMPIILGIVDIMEQPPPIFQFSARKQGFVAPGSSQLRCNRQLTDILWKSQHLVAVAP
jgi:hypothetical protein